MTRQDVIETIRNLLSSAERSNAHSPSGLWGAQSVELIRQLQMLAKEDMPDPESLEKLEDAYREVVSRYRTVASYQFMECLHYLKRQHLCARCGYDIRATPVRCPECGTMRRMSRFDPAFGDRPSSWQPRGNAVVGLMAFFAIGLIVECRRGNAAFFMLACAAVCAFIGVILFFFKPTEP